MYGNEKQDEVTPQTMPVVPAAPQRKQPVRRVGGFTMAICLIAVGIVLIINAFAGFATTFKILQFFPLALVLLGIEILLANLWVNKNNEYVLKYDVVSVLLSIVLLGGALVAAVVPQVALLYHYRHENGYQLSAQMEAAAYEALAQRGDISKVESDIYYKGLETQAEEDLQALSNAYFVSAEVYFKGEFESRQDFAQACAEVLAVLKGTVSHINRINFYSHPQNVWNSAYRGDKHYSLCLEGEFELNYTGQEMAEYSIVYLWSTEREYYIPEEEWEEEMQALQEIQDDNLPPETLPAESLPEESEQPPSGEEPEDPETSSLPEAA